MKRAHARDDTKRIKMHMVINEKQKRKTHENVGKK